MKQLPIVGVDQLRKKDRSMSLETLADHWQVLVISGLMIVAAVIDGWKLKVPNWLTFTMILSGWAYWATVGWSDFGISIAGAFAAGALLIIPYAIGGMGAGDVKMYAGFGAWMVPLPWFGFEHLLWAFAVSAILGSVIAIAMISWRGTVYVNLENTRDIVNDWKSSSSLGEIFDKAKVRKPTLQLLPYGIPLAIGSLAYIAYIIPLSHAPLGLASILGGF